MKDIFYKIKFKHIMLDSIPTIMMEIWIDGIRWDNIKFIKSGNWFLSDSVIISIQLEDFLIKNNIAIITSQETEINDRFTKVTLQLTTKTILSIL